MGIGNAAATARARVRTWTRPGRAPTPALQSTQISSGTQAKGERAPCHPWHNSTACLSPAQARCGWPCSGAPTTAPAGGPGCAPCCARRSRCTYLYVNNLAHIK